MFLSSSLAVAGLNGALAVLDRLVVILDLVVERLQDVHLPGHVGLGHEAALSCSSQALAASA